jgi:two-component system chemotaxis response regulator CheY
VHLRIGTGIIRDLLFRMADQTRVLVVDDQPDVRAAFRYMLEHFGYDVGEAGNGAEALAYLADKKVDVILTDLYMPKMDGLTLVRAVRTGPAPRPAIIAVSGSPNLGKDAALEAARVLGADAILLKPLARDQLIKTIRAGVGEEPPLVRSN